MLSSVPFTMRDDRPKASFRSLLSLRSLVSGPMSSYSASPAPAAAPARIRVVSHPPLPPLRAWLPLAGKETVRDLEGALLAMLKGVQSVEFELQGKQGISKRYRPWIDLVRYRVRPPEREPLLYPRSRAFSLLLVRKRQTDSLFTYR